MRSAFRVQKVMLMVCSKSFFFVLEIWEPPRKSRPLHHARLANETQGFSISDRCEAGEKMVFFSEIKDHMPQKMLLNKCKMYVII